MGERTSIGWTHHTFNAWIGCHKVSPACKHCYAEAFAKRTGKDVWGADKPRYFVGEDTWKNPQKWNRAAEKAGERRRVFCGSMMDVLEIHEDGEIAMMQGEARAKVWNLIEATPWLDWLLLTKRPENAAQCFPDYWLSDGCPPNVWFGTTVENQEYANLRIPHLLKIRARVRFLSCEPLLGPIDLTNVRWGNGDFCNALVADSYRGGLDSDRVHWVIAGGESGPHHREHQLEHSRSLAVQCHEAGVPFFFKQLGESATEEALFRDVSGGSFTIPSVFDLHQNIRARLPLAPRSKGESLDEIPMDLRIREFPRAP